MHSATVTRPILLSYPLNGFMIMGASGAGKSTLLYALSGMDTPSLGTITFGGQDISGLSQDGLSVFRRGGLPPLPLGRAPHFLP